MNLTNFNLAVFTESRQGNALDVNKFAYSEKALSSRKRAAKAHFQQFKLTYSKITKSLLQFFIIRQAKGLKVSLPLTFLEITGKTVYIESKLAEDY